METDKTGIYIDGYQLLELLMRAQYMMTKTDRMVYGTRALEHCEDFLASFVMSYKYNSRRCEYADRMCAGFEAMKLYLRIIAERNLIKCPDPCDTKMKPDTMKINIFCLVGRLDEGVAKWKRSVDNKGKTGTDTDTGSSS